MVAVVRNTVFCTTFRRSGDNNSHVRNFTFADKIWSDRLRLTVNTLRNMNNVNHSGKSESGIRFQPFITVLQRHKKKRFRLENQCQHTPRNTKKVRGGFCIQEITKFGAFPPSLYPISLSLSYAFLFSEAASKLCS